jgi:hypothetical protein
MKAIVRSRSTTGGTIRGRARAIAVRQLRWVGRRCPSREGAEIMELVWGEKISRRVGTGGAPALRRRGRPVLRKLMCLLLGVEHHLVISPLSELSVRIEERAVWRDLTLLGWVHLVRLLVGVLVEGSGVKGLTVGIPPCLLLLDGVGIVVVLWRRRNSGGRRGRIVRRRHALAGNRGVG